MCKVLNLKYDLPEYSNYNRNVLKQTVLTNELYLQTNCTYKQTVLKNKLYLQTNCTYKQIVLTNKLCLQTHCTYKQTNKHTVLTNRQYILKPNLSFQLYCAAHLLTTNYKVNLNASYLILFSIYDEKIHGPLGASVVLKHFFNFDLVP